MPHRERAKVALETPCGLVGQKRSPVYFLQSLHRSFGREAGADLLLKVTQGTTWKDEGILTKGTITGKQELMGYQKRTVRGDISSGKGPECGRLSSMETVL